MIIPVTPIGRVTADPEVKTSKQGNQYMRFNLAVNKDYGEQQKTLFLKCVLHGETQVQRMVKAGVKKGSLIFIIGELDVEEYEKKDKTKGMNVNVTVYNWCYVTSSGKSASENTPANNATGFTVQMRNFMFRGPSGNGKTEAAKAIAAGLELPYVHITCSANTEITDLLGQILPEMKKREERAKPYTGEYPTLEDIRMDPSTAYHKLTGEYREDITEEEVYNKLIEIARKDTQYKEKTADSGKQTFKYIETDLIKAIRYGYVCEIQEPSIIANPGVLVGLNALLDNCNSITLPTGERIKRHPDCVLIVTTKMAWELLS